MWSDHRLIFGFSFLDKTGSLIKSIGHPKMNQYVRRAIKLEEDETIVGIRCSKPKVKLTLLTNFKFVVCKRVEQ